MCAVVPRPSKIVAEERPPAAVADSPVVPVVDPALETVSHE
jgi:hypothetical protein